MLGVQLKGFLWCGLGGEAGLPLSYSWVDWGIVIWVCKLNLVGSGGEFCGATWSLICIFSFLLYIGEVLNKECACLASHVVENVSIELEYMQHTYSKILIYWCICWVMFQIHIQAYLH